MKLRYVLAGALCVALATSVLAADPTSALPANSKQETPEGAAKASGVVKSANAAQGSVEVSVVRSEGETIPMTSPMGTVISFKWNKQTRFTWAAPKSGVAAPTDLVEGAPITVLYKKPGSPNATRMADEVQVGVKPNIPGMGTTSPQGGLTGGMGGTMAGGATGSGTVGSGSTATTSTPPIVPQAPRGGNVISVDRNKRTFMVSFAQPGDAKVTPPRVVRWNPATEFADQLNKVKRTEDDLKTGAKVQVDFAGNSDTAKKITFLASSPMGG